MSGTVVVGTQWGDEGKGKITDFLSEDADIIARFSGGNNAGHTIQFGGETYKCISYLQVYSMMIKFH